MQIKTLETVSTEQLADAFNHAFSDYIVKLQMTPESMAAKLKAENIALQFSAGAFEDDELIGFILHGADTINGIKTIYNGGTGVSPQHRGQHITHKLYAYLLPRLAAAGYYHHQLEVIETNEKAINIYKKIGFTAARQLGCYKGKVTTVNNTATVEELENIDHEMLQPFWSFKPTWQNDTPAINRTQQQHKIIGIKENDAVVAYAVYQPQTGRVKQFAVQQQHRKKGLGSSLFHYMCSHSQTGELQLINVDENDAATISFFKWLGLQRFLGQIEMQYIHINNA